MFFCEYCEIFKNSFFIERHLFIILFQNLYLYLYSLDISWYKIDIFHISCVIALFSFMTSLESVLHGYSGLFLYQDF